MGRLSEGMANLKDNISSSRQTRRNTIKTIKQVPRDLKLKTARTVSDLNKERQIRAGLIRQELQANRTRVQQSLSGLNFSREKEQRIKDIQAIKKKVSRLSQTHRNQLADAALEGQKKRGESLSRIRGSVSKLMGNIRTIRSESSKDLSEARRIWSRGVQPHPQDLENKDQEEKAQEKQVHKKTIPGKKIPEKKVQTEIPEPIKPKSLKKDLPLKENLITDDLTLIPGIGQERKKLLNQNGIKTFARLAQSTPQELKEIVGKIVGLYEVELWIEQARDLS